MAKTAGIYVRVSTERQAERASPDEQEKSCRAYCEAHGYTAGEVYRDTERYRVGGKMVEPSGTRADRPQLRRMLADADAKRLDVIIAWREDRLYRGLKPMLPVIECIERNKITIELVTETFDAKMAPIKAAIARMELDGIKERHAMGREAMLASGKPWSGGTLPYGYRKGADGFVELEPVEAEWVKRVNEWYAEGIPLKEIRRRLILGGSPQRGHPSRGRAKLTIDWNLTIVQRLTAYEPYHTGLQVVTTAAGNKHNIPVPVIVDADLARRVQERRARSKAHPARHVKYNYLVDGLAYCEGCGIKLQARSRIRPHGVELSYACKYHDAGYAVGAGANCCKYNAAHLLDAKVWDKVWEMISDDAKFMARIDAKVQALQAAEESAETSLAKLDAKLDNLAIERQKVIGWARARIITEDDMVLQLGGLTIEETALKRERDEKSLLTGNHAERLIEFANYYRAQLRDGGELLTMTPETDDEREEQFHHRRRVVRAIVARVDVTSNKEPLVAFIFDLTSFANGETPSGGGLSAIPLDIKTQTVDKLCIDIPRSQSLILRLTV